MKSDIAKAHTKMMRNVFWLAVTVSVVLLLSLRRSSGRIGSDSSSSSTTLPQKESLRIGAETSLDSLDEHQHARMDDRQNPQYGDTSIHRELSLLERFSFCSRVLEAQILKRGVECTCSLRGVTSTSSSIVEFECSSPDTVCAPLGIICGQPSVQGAIGKQNLLELQNIPYRAAVCIDALAVQGQEILSEPLCIQLPVDNASNSPSGSGSLLLNWINALLGRVENKDDDEVTSKEQLQQRDCIATIGEAECQACTKCETIGTSGILTGYTYDCSNLQAGIVASTCELLPFLTSLFGKRNTVGLFFPKLDGV